MRNEKTIRHACLNQWKINKINLKTPLLIKFKKQYTANRKKQAIAIANQFKKDKLSPPDLQPAPMKVLFSKEEMSIVINQLKNNKSARRHGIEAEFRTEELGKK